MPAGTPATARPRQLMALRFEAGALFALDQTELPWQTTELRLEDAGQVAAAIARLSIRGAPLIGVAAGYGVALALARDPSLEGVELGCGLLRSARPPGGHLAHGRGRRPALPPTGPEAP